MKTKVRILGVVASLSALIANAVTGFTSKLLVLWAADYYTPEQAVRNILLTVIGATPVGTLIVIADMLRDYATSGNIDYYMLATQIGATIISLAPTVTWAKIFANMPRIISIL